jgi:hypothetical protein
MHAICGVVEEAFVRGEVADFFTSTASENQFPPVVLSYSPVKINFFLEYDARLDEYHLYPIWM